MYKQQYLGKNDFLINFPIHFVYNGIRFQTFLIAPSIIKAPSSLNGILDPIARLFRQDVKANDSGCR